MVRYSAPWAWPQSREVQGEHLREFLAGLSALTRKHGLAVYGTEDGVSLGAAPGSVLQTVTNPDGGETRAYTWDDAPMPGIAWDEELRCYLTASEQADLAAIRARSGAVFGRDDDA